MTKLLIIFIVLSILNVVLNTLKSIWTINGGKILAATINAVTFFVYTYVIIYTNCELGMFIKATITAACNFIGVYVVKLIEEKMRKDKLWLIHTTVNAENKNMIAYKLDKANIPYSILNTYNINKIVFDIYSSTQAESLIVKKILNEFNAKYFVSESKTL